MCGIWTRTRFTEPVRTEELVHPIQMLSHRGPDGYGWWSDKANNNRVALVHTRLSIIDLSGGAQPLASHDQRWVGIVNGELYDYDQVREELIAQGVQFSTQSDSEVLLNLYATQGLDGLAKISGEFAFIFYDRLKGEIHFGRDPMGVKPLFYEQKSTCFTLSSEVKALSSSKPEISMDYVNNFVGRAIVPPQTAIAGAEHVWPGRVYKLNLAERSLNWKTYSTLPLGQERSLSLEDSIERVDHELRASVKRRLRADVEVGTYLSGGIDSSLIAAIAADLGAKPKAFTVGFADPDFDESSLAASIAGELGIEHSVVKLSSQNFMDSLIKSVVAFENPITNPHGAAKNLLAAHTQKQVRVVLTGEGADEWFGGYAYLRMRKLQRFIQSHPWAEGSLSRVVSEEALKSQNHLDGASTRYSELASKYFNGTAPALLGRLMKPRLFEHITGTELGPRVDKICAHLKSLMKDEFPNQQLNEWDMNTWMALRTDLLHYILSNVGDRQEMAHSIEGRTPFLDTKLLSVAGQVPEKYLIRGLTEKYILRRVSAKYLSPAHQNRPKKPFFAPIKFLYLKNNRSLVQDGIAQTQKYLPDLDWKNIHHLLNSNKRSLSSPLEGSVISLKLVLFSIGILIEKLREIPSHPTRGYSIPMTEMDILPFERKLCATNSQERTTDRSYSAYQA